MTVTALAELLEAVFPLRCFLCGAAAEPAGPGFACAEHALPAGLPGPRCGRCAARLPDALPDGARCPACRLWPPPFGRALALFDWRAQPAVHPWVFALKYGGRADLARPLGALLGCHWRAASGPAQRDLFTHLPLHPRRRFERGYDQAERLARYAALAAGTPFVPCLRRVRATPVQGGPGAVSRAANVRGAFQPRAALQRRRGGQATGTAPAAGPLAGRRVWLVDDVITSGASAGEATRVLRTLGATAVGVLALARAGGETP